MSIETSVNHITAETLAYTPAIIAAMQAAESTQASGEKKQQAVVNAIIAGSAALAQGAPKPNVQAVAGLVNLFASIFNGLGVFKKK
jgi:hypothetical protein